MSEPKYQEGQLVKIKFFDELKANEYQLLYSDDRLREMSEAEVAIYKVKNAQMTITWYQVGQWGRNLIDIPEAYIKCEVGLPKAAEPMPSDAAYQKSFFEFSNQVKAGVGNGDYLSGDIEVLLKECLACLQDRKSKEEEANTREFNGKLQQVLSQMRDKFFSPSQKDNLKLKPGMLYYDSCVDSNITPRFSPEILKEIEQYSKTQESKSISDFKRVKEWFEKHCDKDNLWMYANHYRAFKTHKSGTSLESCMGDLKISIDSNNTDGVLDKLASLLSRAVFHIIITENPKETDNDKLIKAFYSVTERMLALYRRKNKDYGDSFAKSLDEDGLLVAKIRIGDKVNRYSTLVSNKNNAEVKDESLVDTLIDMANYAVMTIMWIENQTDKSLKK